MERIPRKILFIAASGIGNTILTTPLIQRAREMWPQARIDLLTSRRTFQSPLTRSDLIDEFFDLERHAFTTLLQLRRRRYDVSINCFPSNRWQFNVVAAIIGAELRVTHAYAEGNRMSWLMNRLVPATESWHDIEQNLQLLNVLAETNISSAPPPIFATKPIDEQQASEWLREQGLENIRLVGVHVGGVTPGTNNMLMNRPLGAIKSPRFEDLRRDLAKQPPDAEIIMFGGAEEESTIEAFRASLPADIAMRCHRYYGDLWTTAALVRKCSFFISGDTALMHMAAVFQVPQKAYFIASNPSRTAPRNPKASTVIEKGCASYRYPFSITKVR
jgi:ADP-heptose:LPS heptosyltransferase